MSKIRKLTVLFAALALIVSFTTVAYAYGGEATTSSTASSASNSFTPSGTGTVINTASDADGKEFYTITTLDKNVFYLVIDRERNGNNVYFLNAVTEKDLLALAEKSGNTDKNSGVSAVSTAKPETAPEVTATPQTAGISTAQKPTTPQSNIIGTLLLVLAIVLIGGGAGYYFKIYRPKHQQADREDDYDYNDENDLDDAEQVDDLPPWEDEDSEDGEA